MLAVCLFSLPVEAQTSTYVFLPDQSTIVQTGGIAGIHRTYTITGMFQLTADFEAGTASFDWVDANAVNYEPSRTGKGQYYNLDPNEVFNMTSLAGAIVDGGESIRFDGTADDGSSIQIMLTLADDNISLKGETIPPPDSADFFIFTLDAVARPKCEYGGGSGTPHDPYQIATAADLIALGDSPEDYDKHFILTADIDLSGYSCGRALIAPYINGIEPLFQGTPFVGVFDGNGYTISNLTIAGESYLGLFGCLDSEAEIHNLCLEAVDVNGIGHTTGGLVGQNGHGSSITNSYSTGTVSSTVLVGGLVGDNRGSVTTSYSTATVRGEGWAARAGGLVGYNPGSITTSYSTGAVTGGWCSGGLVGHNVGGGELGVGIITASYSTGAVSGDSDVGGLVGYNYYGTVTASFWDIETSGQTTSDGGTGKTKAEMQKASTFLDAGWDFVNVWGIGENQTYPYLRKYSAADINQDASVNFLDLAVLAENWLAGLTK